MSIWKDAEEKLRKELLRHKANYENEISKINSRLGELDRDANPADMYNKETGDTLKIVLGKKAHR